MSALYADSTIAMSAYNALALMNGGGLDELFDSVCKAAHPELTREQFKRAVDELVGRRLLVRAPVNSSGGARMHYSVADAQRRLVVGRHREDMIEEDDGRWSGGWNFWVVRSANGALQPMTEVIR